MKPRAPIELALVEAEDRPAAPTPERSPPPAPDRSPTMRGRHRDATTPAPAAPRPALPLPDVAVPERPPPPPRPIDLSFDALAAGAKDRAAVARDPHEDLERLLAPPPDRRPRSLDEARAQAERRAGAEANVRAGRADPLLFDYLRDARERLTPAATRIAEGLPLGPAESVKGWARGYLGAVDAASHGQYAPVRPASGPDDPAGGPRPDVLGAIDEAQRQAASGAEARVAEVCLGIAPGHAVVATLRRSSGNAALDALALDSFRAAGDGRPVAADVRPALACYRVRISAYRVPPLPAVGIDLAHGRVIYPLKRMTNVTVDLQSVDFGPQRGPPSLLRAP
ncbi:MAG TPA: hypothetical protein VHO06_24170 [Polyangia bacterium]|nr:hypothetical protein [Polyangia bacterium]